MSEIARSTFAEQAREAIARLAIAAAPASHAKAKGQIIVTAGLEQGQRAFK